MTRVDHPETSDRHLKQHLEELIAALDRRVPQTGREGERDIADEAAALKEKAIALLAALESKP